SDVLDRHRDEPVLDIGLRIYERDREAAGTVVGSAIAFRLFLFFVPMVLFLVGVAGFFGDVVSAGDVQNAGVTGALAGQINNALTQPTSTRWLAVLVGLTGMATTGRTLSRALAQASCLAWRLPMSSKASVRVIGSVVGLVVGMGIVATIINRIARNVGDGVTGLSFIAVFALYGAGWVLLSGLLPRPTSDPGVLLPGAAIVGASLTGLQAVSQLYLPGRFSHASELYGAIGATIVILGWFFIAGRIMVLSMAVDAAVFERFGSVSDVVFALPVVRILPRRWPWFRRAFDLDAGLEHDDDGGDLEHDDADDRDEDRGR
ncbi:MAG: YhjD/YihY/BrkB family envelope integrity protein, partial [Ilumatobacteraceae bacterium]